MSVFSPFGGSVKPPLPSGVNNESIVALPLSDPSVNVCRITNAPITTRFIFGDSSVSFSGGKVGCLINTTQTEFYRIPDGATHIVFSGGGNATQNINLTTGKMVAD